VATAEVAPDECPPFTYITVDVSLPVSSAADLNENGVPDECELGIVPTVSQWSLALMALLLLTAGTHLLRSRRRHCRAPISAA